MSTRFGCVTHSKGHDWAEADGILGMGFPAAALRSVPFPLFWALSDETRINQDQSNVLTNRVFTLMLSEDRGTPSPSPLYLPPPPSPLSPSFIPIPILISITPLNTSSPLPSLQPLGCQARLSLVGTTH